MIFRPARASRHMSAAASAFHGAVCVAVIRKVRLASVRRTPSWRLPGRIVLREHDAACKRFHIVRIEHETAARLRRRRPGWHRLQHHGLRSSGTTAGRCFGRATRSRQWRLRFPAKIGSSLRTRSSSSSAPASASSSTESCAPLLSVPKRRSSWPPFSLCEERRIARERPLQFVIPAEAKRRAGTQESN